MIRSFLQYISEDIISPSTEPNTLTLWHGGNLGIDFSDHKKGRYEFGVGLYLTTHYGTAQRYSKGSRKMYQVIIRKGNNLGDTLFDYNDCVSFVNSYVPKSKRKEVMERMVLRTVDGKINGRIFNNILINNDAIKPSDTNRLRNFIISQGAQYTIEDNAFGWGERMIVLFDMKLIVKYVAVAPKDKIEVFDLPTEFN